MAEVMAALTDRTRAIIINTPQNPTGKVFTKAELSDLAAVLDSFPRVVVIADEVYEHLVRVCGRMWFCAVRDAV